MNTDTLLRLQAEIYAVNVSKGWHVRPLCGARAHVGDDGSHVPPQDVDVDRVLAKLALVHSELSEAYEEALHGRWSPWHAPDNMKPEGFIVEIADACIRVLDTCEALGVPLYDCESLRHHKADLVDLHAIASEAVEAARVGDWLGKFRDACAHFIADAQRCELGSQLLNCIRLKVEYNKTRSHRHGGKLA